jgi:ElaB/YqjD/DUF883 family membrane-anchored ribosome-binding protein
MATQPHDAPSHASTPDDGSMRSVDDARPAGNDRQELRAIGAEIDQIKESVAHIAEATSHYLKRRVAENSTDLIAENPLRAALWAAFAGFVIGRLSR